ncbi:MAG TPA: response regulator transcription factor [Burkholderiales bacterium]|nr:response regulator transcription factor [Burkholderiales bacterium]
MHVLIVDDDALIRAILAQVVRRAAEDAAITSVADLDAAFSHIAHERKPDLALLDLGLPGQRGMESLQRFRWKFPDVPVVVVSVNEDAKVIQFALKAGARGYIPKSSTPETMVNALKDVLAGKTYAP